MHGSFQNGPCDMIYDSFGGYFNWQFVWHHLHAWQFFQNSSRGMIYGSFGWLFQLVVSLAPFVCMAVSMTGPVA